MCILNLFCIILWSFVLAILKSLLSISSSPPLPDKLRVYHIFLLVLLLDYKSSSSTQLLFIEYVQGTVLFLSLLTAPSTVPCMVQAIGECWLNWVKLFIAWASLVAQTVKDPPAMQETCIRSLGWEDPLEMGKATYSSILAWRIPWTV